MDVHVLLLFLPVFLLDVFFFVAFLFFFFLAQFFFFLFCSFLAFVLSCVLILLNKVVLKLQVLSNVDLELSVLSLTQGVNAHLDES